MLQRACGTRVEQHSPLVARRQMECPATSDPARNTFCVMATIAAGERVISIALHVVKSRNSSVKKILFQQCF